MSRHLIKQELDLERRVVLISFLIKGFHYKENFLGYETTPFTIIIRQILVFMLIQSLQLFIFFLVEKKNALTTDQIGTNRTKKQSDLKSPKHEWEE